MVEALLKELLSAPKTALEEMVAELDLERRALLLAELQSGWTRAVHEELCSVLFRATRGETLVKLKELLDGGRGHRDLHQLLFHDVDDVQWRTSIIEHFAEEARQATRRLHVLSDIDDTVLCNWKDERYPKKTLYPGVVTFYRELSGLGPDSTSRLALTFVSARPGDRLGIVESKTLDGLSVLGLVGATMLAGTFSSALGNARIAAKKLENFLEYTSVYPERDFVFVGDSGQGDVAFGEAMMEKSKAAHTVFIHDVVATPEARRAELREKNVFLFDTYAGAALVAKKRGLLSEEAAKRVVAAVRKELEEVPWRTQAEKDARLADLARDEAAHV